MMDATNVAPLLNYFAGQGTGSSGSLQKQLPRMLRAIRTHLGMDVAFVSEFMAGRRVFRYVDSSHPDQPVRPGGADPLEESYCQRVVDGRLPELMSDAAKVPEACVLPVTAALPVGAHMSVPIRLKNGQIYGTFCCFSFTPDLSLNERDLSMMRVFAEIAAEQIDRDLEENRSRLIIESRIHAVLSDDSLTTVYQPIYHLGEDKVVGFESLSRFSAQPVRAPDLWFNEAAQVGLGVPLEIKAIKQALQGIGYLPDDVYVSINASPETILDESFESAFQGRPLERVVLEVTEHAAIEHYNNIAVVMGSLRDRGLRIAVDDAGAGYASFRHILSLSPDIIKLDISITRNIHDDFSRRALASAFVSFANETNSKIVAEGVETVQELATLRELGFNNAQGYFLGKPMAIEDATLLCSRR